MEHSTGDGDPAAADHFGSPLDYAVTARDRGVIGMVRRAVEAGDVMLAFQPVAQAARPEQPAFYEGLIRVLDETGRIIPARDFIETVETLELGRKIDCLALEMGLMSLAQDPSLRLSINLSARSIGYPGWRRVLEEGLRAGDLVAERLILEITESSAMALPDLVTVFMKEMRLRGISFALDDFGSGQTSFRYLRDFYFDMLKVDGQFIRDIARNPDNQVLAGALLSIAQHFEMLTVAEGVETAEDAEFLIGMGFDCLQGYFFGAPSVVPPWHRGDGRARA